jgi:PAS domain S-box-containing protein
VAPPKIIAVNGENKPQPTVSGETGLPVSKILAMKDEAKTKEQLIEDLAALRDRCTEEDLENYNDTGTAVNALLRLSLEDYSLEELLRKALDIILSVTSVSIETKGCIFLVEDEPEVLIQKVQKGLAEPLLKECARVPFGKCLCGRAASMKRIEFADHIDERHENNYEGIAPHGHYCVPILLSGNTIGVINLYLKDGHSRVGREEEFFDSVANTLTGIMKRKWAEEALRESEEKYRSIVENAQEGIYRTTPEGRFITVNRAMADMLGYDSPEELIASFTDIAHQLYVNPEDRTKLRRMVGEHGSVKGFETQFYRKDGNWIWVSINTRAVHDTNGRTLYYEGINEDITIRKQAEDERKRSFERLRRALRATIEAVAMTVETRDPYTAGHQRRVSDLARAIATEMGLSGERIDGIRMVGTIHDIGKLCVPSEILSNPTKLTNIEFSLIKEHSRKGYEILKNVESPWPLAEIVYQHHERMNGSGYPRNLKGDDILVEARILAVADVVESMASHRPYRPALGIDAALEEIEKNMGILYDNTVANACLRLFREKCFQLKGT